MYLAPHKLYGKYFSVQRIENLGMQGPGDEASFVVHFVHDKSMLN